MIVKIHGTHGSGKSTLVRELMKRWRFGELQDNHYEAPLLYGQPLARRFERAVVLGPYRTACGGMDAVGANDTRLALVRAWKDRPEAIVFFEGVLASTTYGGLGEMSERSRVKWVYLFLDTPAEECVRRVRERRHQRGDLRPFDPERSLLPKIKAIESVKRRAAAAGHVIYTVDSRKSSRAAVNALLRDLEKL